ncbi:unnamed protein product [Linum trigynum]|uniref:Uncharacterized protein n=1 Tax=Linum trigynum TaxID=586398 RepID=A0AAV2FA78_9ROSI
MGEGGGRGVRAGRFGEMEGAGSLRWYWRRGRVGLGGMRERAAGEDEERRGWVGGGLMGTSRFGEVGRGREVGWVVGGFGWVKETGEVGWVVGGFGWVKETGEVGREGEVVGCRLCGDESEGGGRPKEGVGKLGCGDGIRGSIGTVGREIGGDKWKSDGSGESGKGKVGSVYGNLDS